MNDQASSKAYVATAPMLLCRVSWLRNYDGRKDDALFSNHSWVTDGNYPHESTNFSATPDGLLQGFVQVRDWGKINIDRLGADPKDDEINGVTVVWCAQHPSGRGLVVVGWYTDATVFRVGQKPRATRAFYGKGETFVRFEAKAVNSVLLDVNARNFVVQPKGAPRGSVFGQSDLCYVEERLPKIAAELKQYISGIGIVAKSIESNDAFSGESDTERNAKVEKAAIDRVIAHYSKWSIKDRQSDNCGWDIEARKSGKTIRIEVKGRSPSAPAAVRLSPNEERAFVQAINDAEFAKSYRLAIVHDALGKSPELRLFGVGADGRWICEITGEGLFTQSAGIFASPVSKL